MTRQRTKPRTPPEGEAFFAQMVMRHSSDGVVICDPARRAVWVNAAFTTQMGYTTDDMAGKDPGSVLKGPETDPATTRAIHAACAARREIRTDILNYTRSGTAIWVDLKITPVYDDSGRHTHFISTMRDISERKALEQQNEAMRHAEELRQTERHLLALTSEWLYSARSFDELLMVIQRATHTLIPEADGALYIYDNSRATLELATSWGTMPDFPPRIQPDDCWALRRGRAYNYGLKPIQFACDHVGKSGTPYFCLPIIAHGETIGLMHVLFDGFEEDGLMRHMREEVLRNRWDISLICAEQISLAVANVRLRQELHDRSVRDALTGLSNRRWFTERAAREIEAAARDQRPMALILLDVDHFKSFNDSFGHDAGDLVLREVGAILQRAATEQVHPCRIGGEEFALLCSDHDLPRARDLAEAVRKRIAAHSFAIPGQALPQVTVSAGIGLAGRDAALLEDVMKAADQALYRAKAAGRNCVVAGSAPAPASDAATATTG